MSVSARNLALTAHVTFSVGWLGAVGAFLRVHMVPIARLAAWAREPALAGLDVRPTQVHLATEAGIAAAALLAAPVLSVYKPRGMTGHGRRALEGRRAARGAQLTPASSDVAG